MYLAVQKKAAILLSNAAFLFQFIKNLSGQPAQTLFQIVDAVGQEIDLHT